MKSILVLEDNQHFLNLITEELQILALQYDQKITVQVVETQQQTENLKNLSSYDAALLDYYAPDGTFHVFDIKAFGAKKVISISTSKQAHQLARQKGVERCVSKNYDSPVKSVRQIVNQIEEILWPKSIH